MFQKKLEMCVCCDFFQHFCYFHGLFVFGSVDGLYVTGDTESPIVHLRLKKSSGSRRGDEALLQQIVEKVHRKTGTALDKYVAWKLVYWWDEFLYMDQGWARPTFSYSKGLKHCLLLGGHFGNLVGLSSPPGHQLIHQSASSVVTHFFSSNEEKSLRLFFHLP